MCKRETSKFKKVRLKKEAYSSLRVKIRNVIACILAKDSSFKGLFGDSGTPCIHAFIA